MNIHPSHAPSQAVTAPSRRGACPALTAPMQTGDGLLIRLSPVSGGLSPKQLIGLCESAAEHGNGIVEVTARGSLQFRGFSDASAVRFASEVDALGIVVRTGVPVETSPLAGLDPTERADPSKLADALRTRIANAGLSDRLGPKVSVVVDSGGIIRMDAIAADVRLMAVETDGGGAWTIALAGDAATAKPLGSYDEATAVDIVISILAEIAALGVAARGSDLNSAQSLVRYGARASNLVSSAKRASQHSRTSPLSPNPSSPSPSPSPAATPLPPPEGEDGRRGWGPSSRVGNSVSEKPETPPNGTLSSTLFPSTEEVRSQPRRPSSPSGGGRGVEGVARDGEGEGGARSSNCGGARWSNSLRPMDAIHSGIIGGAPIRQINSFSSIPLNSSQLALPIALPFGHTDATTLIELAHRAKALGVTDIRPAPDRRLLLICPSEAAAGLLKRTAAALRFITSAADIRARIAACPGAPGCASGHIAARAIAEDLANALGDARTDEDLSIHISGCEKGCARQAPATVTIVGGENGAGLVVHGTTRAAPLAYRSPTGLIGAIAEIVARLREARTSFDASGSTSSTRAGEQRPRPDNTTLAKIFARG